jgi:hypothetical protein
MVSTWMRATPSGRSRRFPTNLTTRGLAALLRPLPPTFLPYRPMPRFNPIPPTTPSSPSPVYFFISHRSPSSYSVWASPSLHSTAALTSLILLTFHSPSILCSVNAFVPSITTTPSSHTLLVAHTAARWAVGSMRTEICGLVRRDGGEGGWKEVV